MSLLCLEGVSKTCRGGGHRGVSLEEITLSLRAGECVVIWGPRCAGKTTLLAIAAGLSAPERGKVRYGFEEPLSERELGRPAPRRLGGIAWVRPCEPTAERLWALDYAVLASQGALGRRCARVAALMELDRLGVSPCSHIPCAQLSDLERLCVGLAGALARRPSVLLVDDPAACRSPRERGRAMATLCALAEDEQLGVLVTVSDIPSLMYAHRAGSLVDGRLLLRDPLPVAVVPVELTRSYAFG